MTNTTRLNDLQLVLLANASARANGSVVPLPESCARDTARIRKAVASLLRRKLVEEIVVIDSNLTWREQDQDKIGLFITEAGRAAIGSLDEEQSNTPGETATTKDDTCAHSTTSPSPRPGSKIAAVVALLTRDQGATLDEMVAATGWQAHTTRAALTGLRKKGHDIAKSKREDITCYHIAVKVPA